MEAGGFAVAEVKEGTKSLACAPDSFGGVDPAPEDKDAPRACFCDQKKKMFNKNLRETNDVEYSGSLTIKQFIQVITSEFPTGTDVEGFWELHRWCEQSNGKVIFLTARPEKIREITENQLKSVYEGLNPEVHFASDKGTKLKELSKDWENIVFVDDKIHNLTDVKALNPEVSCYQFEPKKYLKK